MISIIYAQVISKYICCYVLLHTFNYKNISLNTKTNKQLNNKKCTVEFHNTQWPLMHEKMYDLYCFLQFEQQGRTRIHKTGL